MQFPIVGYEMELGTTKNGDIIINLGENCSARGALEAVDIKQESYPFDSCIVPISALINCLLDDFSDYTNPEYFVPYFDQQSPINKYGVVLAHNFPLVAVGKKENGEDLLVMDPQWRDVLPTVQEKFIRRANRFRAACYSDKRVCFFRYLDINYQSAEILSHLLHLRYPTLKFFIMCVDNATTSKVNEEDDWHIPRIRHFYYNVNASSALEEWMRIFQKAGLIQSN